jgi:F-type H+-transporting ATPase subunit gamma
MASLKELKGRINSVKSTQKITKAKQMVAAAKLRRAQAAAEAARPYAERMAAVMASLAGTVVGSEGAPKLLAGTGSDKRQLLVVVNTDKGLCGGLNSNIVRAALTKARALIAEGKEVSFFLVGRKGRAPIKRAFPNAIVGHFDTSEVRNPGYTEAEAIVAELVGMFDADKFDVAHLVYATFKSALVQDPTLQQIIPAPAPEGAGESSGAAVDYEPDEEEILAELLPRSLKTQLFGALLEISASEQGASMTAMDNATRNAGDLINKLTIQYNRSRQAAITTELIEIIAGAEAL